MTLEEKIYVLLKELNKKKSGEDFIHTILDKLNIEYTADDCHEISKNLNEYVSSNVRTAKHYYCIKISLKGKEYIESYEKQKTTNLYKEIETQNRQSLSDELLRKSIIEKDGNEDQRRWHKFYWVVMILIAVFNVLWTIFNYYNSK